MKPILQTVFIQRVIFPDKPSLAMRRALRDAGFRYNGAYWESTTGSAGVVGEAYMMDILTMANPYNNADTAIAPEHSIS